MPYEVVRVRARSPKRCPPAARFQVAIQDVRGKRGDQSIGRTAGSVRQPRTPDFVQVDAFTNRALYGNPAAVVFDADDIPAETMQRIAREMNLSETVFLLVEVLRAGTRIQLRLTQAAPTCRETNGVRRAKR